MRPDCCNKERGRNDTSAGHLMNAEGPENMADVLRQELTGVHVALLADNAGNIVAKHDEGSRGYDLPALAALAVAHYAAMNIVARLIGEKEFSLHLYRGKREKTHFSRVSRKFLLITVSGAETSLTALQQGIMKTGDKIKALWGDHKKEERRKIL